MSRTIEYHALVNMREELWRMIDDHEVCYRGDECPFEKLQEAHDLIDEVALDFAPGDGLDGATARKQMLEEVAADELV